MGGLPATRQHAFALGIALSSGLFETHFSPCLLAAGLRFLSHPMPSEGLSLPYGRATALGIVLEVDSVG